MAENTAIEWATHTFNPWEGCQKVGPGCDHCYAETRNARFGGGVAPNWGPGAPRRRTSPANWRKPLLWDIAAAGSGFRPRVFCASLADWADKAAPGGTRVDLGKLIQTTPNLDWLLLTKRIGNAERMLLEMFPDGIPYNVWLGITVVNQEEADRDIPKLLGTGPHRLVRFLSVEPMLGPIDIRWTEVCSPSLDWVICGGESGADARPMHPEWVVDLRYQCAEAGIPFLFKQWGEWVPAERIPIANGASDCPGGTIEMQSPKWAVAGHGRETTILRKVGKKAAGRLLDGVEHNGYPS